MNPQRISSAPRIHRCPGSVAACEGLEPLHGGKASKAADSGRKCHNAVGTLLMDLPIDDMELTAREEYISNKFANAVRIQESKMGMPPTKILSEVEVYIGEMWVGHWDRVTVFGAMGTIFWEYKTGRIHQEPASSHVQGRLYVVAGVETLRVPYPCHLFVLSAGEEEGEHMTMCVFQEEDVQNAYAEAKYIYDEASKPGAKRYPGQMQCKYCLARGTPRCEETHQMLLVAESSMKSLGADAESMAKALDIWKQVKPYGENVESTCRGLMNSGVKLPGWQFGTPKTDRDIPDTLAAESKLVPAVVARPEFGKCCTLSTSSLCDSVYRSRSTPKEGEKKLTRKAATELVESTLGDLLVKTKQQPPIVREKEEEE